jgi:hypothetical protein
MLFSADNAHGILSVEAGIADSQIMKSTDHHCTGFHMPAQYFCSSIIVEAFFIGTVRIHL